MSTQSERFGQAYARPLEHGTFDNAVIIDPLQDEASRKKWSKHGLVSISVPALVPTIIDLTSLTARYVWVKKFYPNEMKIEVILSTGKQQLPKQRPPKVVSREQPEKYIEIIEREGQKPIGIYVFVHLGQNPRVPDRHRVKFIPLYEPNIYNK